MINLTSGRIGKDKDFYAEISDLRLVVDDLEEIKKVVNQGPPVFLSIAGDLTQNHVIMNNQVALVFGTFNSNGFSITTQGNGQVVFIC